MDTTSQEKTSPPSLYLPMGIFSRHYSVSSTRFLLHEHRKTPSSETRGRLVKHRPLPSYNPSPPSAVLRYAGGSSREQLSLFCLSFHVYANANILC